ncbi:hypothetical protein HPB49_005052 [Dermacentor silvarum]|uniref:Uncharacterized protein n=1 Tax=Dermacentor silvarum TaxID=543639 RepID=A0ACB8DVH7_DERSI|nr:hypothetical protein HPB49_005052 [Dermacentor silvarum]
MVNCAVYGCSKRSKNKPNEENFQPIGFYVVPRVKLGPCLKTVELWSRRRALWLSRIHRKDLDESATHYRVCGAHFITGDEECPASEQPTVQHLAGHTTPEEPSSLECTALQDNAATVLCHLQVDLQNNQASACMIDKEVTADLLSAHISSLEDENRRLQHDLASAHSRLAKAVPGDRNVFRSNTDMVLFYTGLQIMQF